MDPIEELCAKIHLSEMDEFLALRVLEQPAPVGLSISKIDAQGNVSVTCFDNQKEIDDVGIDFELLPSEYQFLDSVNISDYTSQTVFTSSAYEFFDFLLMYYSEIRCIADFNGISWRIKIISCSE